MFGCGTSSSQVKDHIISMKRACKMTTVRSRPGTMTTMTASIIVGGASLILATTLPSSIALACGHVDAPEEPRLIQVAICLDTSGSMDGLIDAARQKLWAIVNDLALAKPTPRLEVALLTYGNDGHKEADGWVAVQSPLTRTSISSRSSSSP